jgi:hypothetical protein
MRATQILRAIVVATTAIGTFLGSGAGATVITTSCGSVISSFVRTSANEEFNTSSPSFVSVPSAGIVVAVPGSVNRCLKVRFAASTSCGGNENSNVCRLRAVLNNTTAMHPIAPMIFDASDNESSFEAQAFEWVRRVSPGTHTIRIQARVDSQPAPQTNFGFGDWTLEVELTN